MILVINIMENIKYTLVGLFAIVLITVIFAPLFLFKTFWVTKLIVYSFIAILILFFSWMLGIAICGIIRDYHNKRYLKRF